MVVLSFSIPAHKPMLLDGRKDQTIRLYKEKRFNQIKSARNLEIYWKLRMPRNKGGSEKLFDARRTEVFPIYLYAPIRLKGLHNDPWPWFAESTGALLSQFTIKQTMELVQRDGFQYRSELYDALAKLHRSDDLMKLFFVTRFARKVA